MAGRGREGRDIRQEDGSVPLVQIYIEVSGGKDVMRYWGGAGEDDGGGTIAISIGKAIAISGRG